LTQHNCKNNAGPFSRQQHTTQSSQPTHKQDKQRKRAEGYAHNPLTLMLP